MHQKIVCGGSETAGDYDPPAATYANNMTITIPQIVSKVFPTA
jgi:hypothetical protein